MKFVKKLSLNVPAEFAFQWHENPGALRRLMPPWEDVRILKQPDGIQPGTRVEMSVPIGPIRNKWVAEHTEYEYGKLFKDVQVSGPFAKWEHTHRFLPTGETSCELIDEVEFEPPLGPLGKLGSGFAQSKLEAMFEYRHRRTACETAIHYRDRDLPKLKVLISGSSGMIGTALSTFLTSGGHEVWSLVRDLQEAEQNSQSIFWDIKAGKLHSSQLEGFDVVVHLAGANIAGQRWTPEFKEKIVKSRTESTHLLASALAAVSEKPQKMISASAVGYYGDRGEELLTENSTSGNGFLAETAQQWEAAADPAREARIPVIHPRIGLVLSPRGGALEKLQTPFALGGGGVVGSGKQYWPGISLHDIVGAFYHCMREEQLNGPVNFVCPEPTTNREFVKTLGKVMHRPTIVPLPEFAVKTAMGEMGDALLLHSTRVTPVKLQESGYEFQHPTLEEAFRIMLGEFK